MSHRTNSAQASPLHRQYCDLTISSQCARVRRVCPGSSRGFGSTNPPRRRRSIRCRSCRNSVDRTRFRHRCSLPPDTCHHREHKSSRTACPHCTPPLRRSRRWSCSRECSTCLRNKNTTHRPRRHRSWCQLWNRHRGHSPRRLCSCWEAGMRNSRLTLAHQIRADQAYSRPGRFRDLARNRPATRRTYPPSLAACRRTRRACRRCHHRRCQPRRPCHLCRRNPLKRKTRRNW